MLGTPRSQQGLPEKLRLPSLAPFTPLEAGWLNGTLFWDVYTSSLCFGCCVAIFLVSQQINS